MLYLFMNNRKICDLLHSSLIKMKKPQQIINFNYHEKNMIK